MTCKLIIEKGYKEIEMHFDTLVEAGEFINVFSRHVEHEKGNPWLYKIFPIVETDSDSVEDDIPVQ